jgi:uncharacterized protein YgiM (DUF1202 family)
MEDAMKARFTPVAIAGWLACGATALAILLPGSAASFNVLSAAQHPPVAAVPTTAVNQEAAAPGVVQPPPKLAALVWPHGDAPAKTAAVTPSANQADQPSSAKTANIQLAALTAPAQQQPEPLAQPDALPSPKQFRAASAVNVRADPQNQSPKLFVLQQGENVELLSSNAGWIEVRTQSGQTGWVYSRFLSPAQAN